MIKASRQFMDRMKPSNFEGASLGQITYAMSTLLNQCKQLETSLHDLALDAQNEESDQIQIVYEEPVQGVSLRTGEIREDPRPHQADSVGELQQQFGHMLDQHLDSGLPAAKMLLAGLSDQPDDEPNPAPSPERPQKPKKRAFKTQRPAKRSGKKRRRRRRPGGT